MNQFLNRTDLRRQSSGFTRTNFSKKSFGGFTIIETLIVLAVAGLIISIIFLAIPQLQRNSRDQNRKAIANRLSSAIESYGANHEGAYPFNNVGASCLATGESGAAGDWNDFYANNLDQAKIKDPSLGTPVIPCNPIASFDDKRSYITPFPTGSPNNIKLPATKGILSIVTNASCSGSTVAESSGAGSYAIIIGLDNAGTHYCIDNS